MKKHILLTLVLALLLTLVPFSAQAAETPSQTEVLPFHANPLYEGFSAVPAKAPEITVTESKQSQTLKASGYVSFSEAVTQLRSALRTRATTVDIYVEHSSGDYEAVANDLLTEAMAHTGNPTEGDYLLWQFYGWGGEVYYEYLENGNYGYQFLLNLEYYTTAAQENELNTAVKNLLSSLGVSSMTDYQKVKAVYDYMIQNIVYDEAHLNDETYTLQFTAYAALVNKTAVCQGYATLLYRLMLEMGIDCRIIAGETENGGHAWNIVKLGDVYYNLDATWDAGYDDYAYFLRNSDGFADHYRYLEYATTQFHTQYPMSETDYVDGVAGQPEHIYVYGVAGDEAYYSIDRDGVLTIWGTGEIADFAEPNVESEDEYPVPWIYWLDGFDTVIVEDGITTIGQNTFSCLNNIKYITLPDSVTTIDDAACVSCENLVSIELGNNVETIGTGAFYGCYSLPSIELPDSLLSISSTVFQNCISLTEITIPKNITRLESYTFSGCSKLEKVNLDNGSLTEIGEYAFESCTSLTSVDIPDTVTLLERCCFMYCTSLSQVDLSASLVEIGYDAFYDAPGQAELVLPEGLKIIGNGAFGNWDLLTEITIPDSVTSLSGFAYCDNLTTVNHNGLFTELGSGAFSSCTSLPSFTIPEGVTNIGDGAFSNCDSLTEMVVPAGASLADGTAFYDCENLRRVELHCDGIIGSYAFGYCRNLSELVITGDLTQFDMCAFSDCTSLTSFTFTDSVTKIEASAFNCCGLAEIWFLGDAPEFGSDAFCGVTATAYYTASNPTWTEDKLQNYGGNLTWVNGHYHEFTEDAPVFDAETRTHTRYCTSCEADVAESCTFIPAITTDASVTEVGVTTRTCSVCGGSYETYFYLRLAGSNRYETAFLAADQLKVELGVEEFENIIVASGTGFADALAGSYLAVVKNAPILLVNKNTVTDVAEYIEANLADRGTVYLLGGEAAVPAAMENLLESLNVKRLAGSNRYATNLEILIEAGFEDQEILVCTGNGFADSLSASAVGKPILLVNKSLTADQKEFLESTSGEFVIIGGEGAVSAAVEAALKEYGTVERLAGANRYETSVLVAEKFFEAPTSAVVAYSQNFPDGLCGGPLAYATDSPLLLMATNRGDNVIAYANEVGIACGAVLGGTGLIDDATARNLFAMN